MELQQLAPPNFATATPPYAYASSPASTSSPMPPSPELWNTNEWNNNNQA